ncbi:acyl-CoA dehydrogenase [Bradyrhizobium sp. CCBAU 21362]|uniref:acyl-CoA dehydrogenase family protein n=1 Tax=Bradyrhizobium sp. CCBAU 21362 TaxID=1325082 RepID=UPI0023065D2E|nr:acyl-CoA dehydrogenase family protein [Bradyrhizobium sp. CCBAU 21362]MDA9535771.1 acyl-CoA dehydrogenase [Bradyrhizobium sp. CCBAU 21362]
MDLSFTEDELAFREEVRAFFRSAVPAHVREKLIAGRHPSRDEMVRWHRTLATKGWSVPGWPVEYGGTGWSPIKQYIFADEMRQTPAPEFCGSGAHLVGPVIYTFGSEAQKQRFLPRIVNVEDWWCQGFSEPGAGSDLASLKMRAVRDQGHYIVNGQKIWTTLAQHADWIFCLVRTDQDAKKQQGISFLLIDMKSPGVSVRPIQLVDGSYEVNEVFFDDVRVPVENLVGEENRGWDYAKYLLGNERVLISPSKERIRRVKDLAARTRVGGERLIDRRDFREKLAALELQIKALEITQLRVIASQSSREKDTQDPASSILKIKGAELEQAAVELLLDVIGPYALPYMSEEDLEAGQEPPIGADWGATIAPSYFNIRKVSIYGGSDEIQKNIIAKAILGL